MLRTLTAAVGRALVQATILELSQSHGMRLFDAGTTAGYFEHLYGFRRTTRAEFVRLWRKHRCAPHTQGRGGTDEAVRRWRACTAMRSLLTSAQQPAAGSSQAAASSSSSRVKRTRRTPEGQQQQQQQQQHGYGEQGQAQREQSQCSGGTKIPVAVTVTGPLGDEAALRRAFGVFGDIVRCIVSPTGSGGSCSPRRAIVQFAVSDG